MPFAAVARLLIKPVNRSRPYYKGPATNPIEMPFSKFKAFLRKVLEPTVRDLCRRIGSLVPTIGRTERRDSDMPATRPYDWKPL
jgi:hypothetical protein